MRTIPFRIRTGLSDLTCHDGEIELSDGFSILPTVTPGTYDDPDISDTPGAITPSDPDSLGQLPAPGITFSLVRTTLPGWHLIADAYPQRTVYCNNPSLDAWGAKAATLLGDFLTEAAEANRFVEPFLALAAWRLNDGNLAAPSLPVLLIPNSEAPLVAAPSADADTAEMDMRIAAAVCSLYFKLELPESLRTAKIRPAALEILVSKPLWLFDSSKSFLPCNRISTTSFCHSLDQYSGEATERRVCAETFPLAWKPAGRGAGVTSLTEFFTICSIPFKGLLPVNEFKEVGFNCGTLSEAFTGTGFTPTYSGRFISGFSGMIDFKGRKLIWNPEIRIPGYEGIDGCRAYTTTDIAPRWIFHPDPDAEEYQYDSSSGVRKRLPLKHHHGISGSYYFSGLTGSAEPETADTFNDGYRTLSFPGYIWLGEKSEAALFTDAMLQDLECGEIIAVCRAFRSSALAATVTPTLYVFSKTGVYLYRQNSGGIFKEAGLITAYRLSDAGSLWILPKGVRFLTDAGETVTIEGTSVKTGGGGSGSSATAGEIILAGTGERGRLVTRPLKLGSAGEFKRVKRVYLRGHYDPATVEMALFGSRDMMNWYCLGRRSGGGVVALYGGASRFYRLEVGARLKAGQTLEGVLFA